MWKNIIFRICVYDIRIQIIQIAKKVFMRKLLLFVTGVICFNNLFAQTPTLRQKLYYTCKVWGFVKYYNSNVNSCNVNWDSVLISVLPKVESAATTAEFNDALDTMLAAAGPMALSTTYFPDTLALELKRNRDWSWISTSLLRSDVQIQLDTIKNNFRPHANCWVVDNYGLGSIGATGGWLAFPHDSLEMNINSTSSFPDNSHLLLMFFKYWNIIKYFNPNNYVLDTAIDNTLSDYVLQINSASNARSLYLLYLKIATQLNDAHVYGLTYSSAFPILPDGIFQPLIRLAYVNGEYVITKSLEAGINPGDVLLSVDGLTTTQWEDSLKNYYSAGNSSVFRRTVCENILDHMYGSTALMSIEDSSGISHTHSFICDTFSTAFYNSYYYPADSLVNISWTKMQCEIGYINIGNISYAGVDSAYAALRTAPAIIVDIRNYPLVNSAVALAPLMYSSRTEFAKLLEPDVTYPGTFFWHPDSLGITGNPTPYTGKVIILVNEQTQSAAEFSSMILKAIPGAIVVGSQTAGADGNITYWKICQDLHVGFTNLGVFYPNGDSTQRIGIVPDSVVYPTKAGIRHHDDELLDKALQIAGCNLSVKNAAPAKQAVNVYPNPANDYVIIAGTGINMGEIMLSITDITGRALLSKNIKNNTGNFDESINIHGLAAGIYYVKIRCGQQNFIKKFVKK